MLSSRADEAVHCLYGSMHPLSPLHKGPSPENSRPCCSEHVTKAQLVRASNCPGLQDGFTVGHAFQVARRLGSGLLWDAQARGQTVTLCRVGAEDLPESEGSPQQPRLMLHKPRLFGSKNRGSNTYKNKEKVRSKKRPLVHVRSRRYSQGWNTKDNLLSR